MSWVCEFTKDAEEDLRKLPKPIQKRVVRVLTEMEGDPFRGDVKPLHGEAWKAAFRRRIGDYRLLFVVNHESRIVSVLRILPRSEKTYR